MRQLHVLGVSDDGATLLLGTAKNATKPTHRILLDDRLRAAARGQLAAPGGDRSQSALTPKEMQARMRAGASPEEIAKLAGIPVARVLPYFVPVEAERSRIVDEARTAVMHRHRGPDGSQPLGELVDARLEEIAGLKDDTVAWTARRRSDGAWVVGVSYAARGGRRKAEWLWQPLRRELTPLDGMATRLAAEAKPAAKKKPVAKRAPARAAGKRAPARKATGRKTAAKPASKPASKPAARKATAAKPAPVKKKAVATKPVAKKAAAKAPVRKAAPAHKAAAVKPTPVKPTPVKPTPVKPTPVKPAAVRAAPVRAARPARPEPGSIAAKVLKATRRPKPAIAPAPAPAPAAAKSKAPRRPQVVRPTVVAPPPEPEVVEPAVEPEVIVISTEPEAIPEPPAAPAARRKPGQRVPLPSWSDVLLGVTRPEETHDEEPRRTG